LGDLSTFPINKGNVSLSMTQIAHFYAPYIPYLISRILAHFCIMNEFTIAPTAEKVNLSLEEVRSANNNNDVECSY
jgi:hypothetical protein